MDNDKVLVIGGSGSIGLEVVKTLHSKGYNILATGNKVKKSFFFSSLGHKASAKIQYISCDFSNLQNTKKFVHKIKSQNNNIHYLINCSGALNRESFETESETHFQKIMNINFFSPRLIIKYFLKKMKIKKKGVILNFSSQVSRFPHPNAGTSYEISKVCLESLSRHIAYSYGKYGIRSNIISPGTIKSKMQKNMSKKAFNILKEKIPLKKIGAPQDVANLVSFLISEKGSYINGANINISGGSILD